MHETTQRRLMRALFLIGCILPTLGLVALAVDRYAGLFERRWQARISQRLGMPVQITGLRTPRPGRFYAKRVTIRTPRSGIPLLSIERLAGPVTVTARNRPAGRGPLKAQSSAGQAADQSRSERPPSDQTPLDPPRSDRLSAWTADRLVIRSMDPRPMEQLLASGLLSGLRRDTPTRLEVTNVVVKPAGGGPVVLLGPLVASSNKAQITLEFPALAKTVDASGDDPHPPPNARVCVRQTGPAHLPDRTELHISGDRFPIGQLLPCFGQHALWTGQWSAVRDRNGWRAQGDSSFEQVDASRLLGDVDREPLLTGTWQVELRGVEIVDGTIQRISGRIVSTEGSVRSDFVEALVLHQIVVDQDAKNHPEIPSPHRAIPFDQMDVGLLLNEYGFALQGRAGEIGSQVALRRSGKPWLIATNQYLPADVLVSALIGAEATDDEDRSDKIQVARRWQRHLPRRNPLRFWQHR